ncbi:hypothetical protein B0T10DRAFT_258645 [Thelonectria olida]|uniref:Rhodopsin domain-containing protein n=1 Tax=Thelonectria olida TaxID=1576542 RepID=A0A9P9ASQ1_9HYPO|nr:hypothetical protein B0T10DRAFT_258645 [Thelonectria olida]
MGASSALVETWCLYSVGSLVIFARVFCRWRTIGIRGFRPDDYIIFLSWITYTVMTVAAHIVGGLGDLHALTLAQRKALTHDTAQPYIYGTKWFCAGVFTYNLFIWSLKLNMLFLYQRVVRGLWVEKYIKPVMLLVGATFVAITLILFCACRPYNRMWIAYPDQGSLCKPQSTLNMVPPLIMNILTDVCIMAIPAPVIIPLKTTLWRRVGLIFLFGAGVFVMIAAILRVTMVLVEKNGATAAIWSCREDFVAIVIGQAILIRPMFTTKFWSPNYTGPTGYSSGPSKNSAHGGSIEMSGVKHSLKSKNKDPFSVTAALATVRESGDNGSTDRIIDNPSETTHPTRGHSPASTVDLEKNGSTDSGRMVIHVNRRVEIENMEATDDNSRHVYRPSNALKSPSNGRCWNEDQGYYGH